MWVAAAQIGVIRCLVFTIWSLIYLALLASTGYLPNATIPGGV